MLRLLAKEGKERQFFFLRAQSVLWFHISVGPKVLYGPKSNCINHVASTIVASKGNKAALEIIGKISYFQKKKQSKIISRSGKKDLKDNQTSIAHVN